VGYTVTALGVLDCDRSKIVDGHVMRVRFRHLPAYFVEYAAVS
jgi:hypothetical protein